MPYHGYRSAPKTAAQYWSQWTCVVCKRKVLPGQQIIGICNHHKDAEGNKGWDHVHAACAPGWKIAAPRRVAPTAPAGPSSSGAQATGSPQVAPTTSAHYGAFIQRAETLQFTQAEASRICQHFNGDTEKALQAMTDIFRGVNVDDEELAMRRLEEAGQVRAMLEEEQANESDEGEEVPVPPTAGLQFDSSAAKQAGAHLFKEFVKPILPKPQTDGSFKDGDPELLNWSLKTPILLVLPRAERMCELLKPPGGWDEDSMAKVRDYFALEAAGNNPGLPQRTPGCPIGPLPPNCPSDPRLPH